MEESTAKSVAEYGQRARHPRPFRPRSSSRFDPGHSDLLVLADGPLGVHVLVSATPLYSARPGGLGRGDKRRLVSVAMLLVMIASIAGNFVAAWLARLIGDRRAIALMCMGYFLAMVATYIQPRDHRALMILLPLISIFSGLFALFTMYLPPLFPHLAAHHWGRLLLQHRPDRVGGWDRRVRARRHDGRVSVRADRGGLSVPPLGASWPCACQT